MKVQAFLLGGWGCRINDFVYKEKLKRIGHMKKAYIKYIISLLIFGSNGIVASYILLSSSEIVLDRLY
jgi:hypothetical protein